MKIFDLLEDWHRRAQESQFAHFGAANWLSRCHLLLGVPAVMLSAIVGTTIFATLQEQSNLYLQIVIGLVSLIAASVVALQTFLKLEERAENHRTAGAAYGAIRRQIQQILYSSGGENELDIVNKIRSRLDDLALESPKVSERIWNKTEKKLAKYNTDA